MFRKFLMSGCGKASFGLVVSPVLLSKFPGFTDERPKFFYLAKMQERALMNRPMSPVVMCMEQQGGPPAKRAPNVPPTPPPAPPPATDVPSTNVGSGSGDWLRTQLGQT